MLKCVLHLCPQLRPGDMHSHTTGLEHSSSSLDQLYI